MSIEHVTIQDPDLHEPKGASSAAANQILRANGAGSTEWVTISSAIDIPYARGSVISNAVARAIPAAIDATLHTPSDYVDFTDQYTFDLMHGFTVNGANNNLVVPEEGVYSLDVWASVSSDTANSTSAGSLMINGVAVADIRPVLKTKIKVANDIVSIAGFGFADLSVGDEVGLSFADDAGSSVTIHESTVSINLMSRGTN